MHCALPPAQPGHTADSHGVDDLIARLDRVREQLAGLAGLLKNGRLATTDPQYAVVVAMVLEELRSISQF